MSYVHSELHQGWRLPTTQRWPTLKDGVEVLGNTSRPWGRKWEIFREERRETDFKKRGEDKNQGKILSQNKTIKQKACGSIKILQGVLPSCILGPGPGWVCCPPWVWEKIWGCFMTPLIFVLILGAGGGGPLGLSGSILWALFLLKCEALGIPQNAFV